MIKDILKKDWPFLLLIIILTICSIWYARTAGYGFQTAYDQAYLLCQLQEAYDGSYITGSTQWNLLAIHLFPYLDLTNKISSYWAANILNWSTILLCAITACVVYDKKRVFMYIGLIFLIYFQNAHNNGGICHSTMHGSILSMVLCFFILYYHLKNRIGKCIFAFLTGFSLAICCFCIAPSSIAISVCIFALVIYTNRADWRAMAIYLTSGILGGLTLVAIVHFAVCPLNAIVDAILETSKFFQKADGYEWKSFLIKYGFFARDFLFMSATLIGIYWLSKRITRPVVGKIFFILFTLVYVYYSNKLNPKIQTDACMAIAMLAFIPYLFTQHDYSTESAKNQLCYYAFLFLFPILAPLGTNTGVGAKIFLYTIAWIFLYFELTHKEDNKKYIELLITVILFFFIPTSDCIHTIPAHLIERKKAMQENTCYYTDHNKNFAKIAITPIQYDYFVKIDSILNEYNYKPHQSTMFAMVYDYSNIYVYDAVNALHYPEAEHIPLMDLSQTKAPDFMFMCKWDSATVAKTLRTQPWGWPEEYDKYSVGCPEDLSIPAWYNDPAFNTRYMYCRKTLKQAIKE